MNGIITLSHFCEFHGPNPIFTTQTIRDRSFIQNSSSNSSGYVTNCEACSSIGNKIIYVSKEEEGSVLFVSSEKCLLGKDHQNSLKQIALKSLCEISVNKEEGLVYLDDSKLNTLCYTFKIKDSQARGFEKLYSIVILMKDKMFLLNTQPFLANNIKEIAKLMQNNALKVYETEHRQFSQRAERLISGKASSADVPRSLKDLIGEQHIFAHLHSLFSWILWSGARCFTEVLTLVSPSLPAFFKDSSDGFTFISMDKEEFLMHNFETNENNDETFNLRNLKAICKSFFDKILYCSLVGLQIIIRGNNNNFLKYFKDFMPHAFHRFFIESYKYPPAQKSRILYLPSSDILVPQNSVCLIEFTSNQLDEPSHIKCTIDLPPKLPALMTKIQYAIDEKMFTNQTMIKYIQAGVEEWKNKVLCLSHSNDDSSQIKKILGIQQQDELLVNYWLSALK